MNDKKPHAINGRNGILVLVATFIVGTGGSGAGTFFYMRNIGPEQLEAWARPDPATGSELRALEDIVMAHVGPRHPDQTGQFLPRIVTLEATVAAQNEAILQRLARIEQKLDQL